jgi:hypothetical protein
MARRRVAQIIVAESQRVGLINQAPDVAPEPPTGLPLRRFTSAARSGRTHRGNFKTGRAADHAIIAAASDGGTTRHETKFVSVRVIPF